MYRVICAGPAGDSWLSGDTQLSAARKPTDNLTPRYTRPAKLPDKSRQLYPSDTGCELSVGIMLGHRLRRWPNIKPTLTERPVSAATIIIIIL